MFIERPRHVILLNHQSWIVWAAAIGLSLISPFLAVALICIIVANASKNLSNLSLGPLAWSCSIWLATINCTKIPESDLLAYQQYFEDARNTNVAEIFSSYQHETFFYALNYFIANIPDFPFAGFIFITTLIFYLAVLYSVTTIGRHLEIDPISISAVVIASAFFPQLFSISAHIVRQMLAGSIILLALTQLVKQNRCNYLLLGSAILFHTSAALFLLLPAVHKISKKYQRYGWLISATVITIGAAMLKPIAEFALGFGFFPSIPIIQYGLSRLSQEAYYELETLSGGALTFVYLILALSAVYCARKRTDEKNVAPLTISTFILFLAILILIFHHLDITELATRFLYYVYLLTCIFLIFLAKDFPLLMKITARFFIISFPYIFLLTLQASPWKYLDIGTLITTPIPLIGIIGYAI